MSELEELNKNEKYFEDFVLEEPEFTKFEE